MFGFENSRQYSETDILQPKVFHMVKLCFLYHQFRKEIFTTKQSYYGETMQPLPLVRCKSMMPFQNQQKLLSVNYDI